MGGPAPSSTADTAALIVASGGFVTAIGAVLGKGIAWVFKQRRGRITGLERDVAQLRKEMTEVVQHCADERLESTRKIDCLVSVCIVLIDGGPHAIVRAKQILGTEFPDLLRRVYPAEQQVNFPDDMQGLLDRANEALARPRRRRAKP